MCRHLRCSQAAERRDGNARQLAELVAKRNEQTEEMERCEQRLLRNDKQLAELEQAGAPPLPLRALSL
jgi:hypothetical protein